MSGDKYNRTKVNGDRAEKVSSKGPLGKRPDLLRKSVEESKNKQKNLEKKSRATV